MRGLIGAAAEGLERFEPPPELRDSIAFVPPMPQPVPPTTDGQPPPPPPPEQVAWVHPLAGPDRTLPANESQRYGAVRPQPRPRECQLGHCGVDLVRPLGVPVYSVSAGVVEHIQRDENVDTVAGRYVIIAHTTASGGETVRSRYIHLDSVEAGLQVGQQVGTGARIGRLGRSGVFNAPAHLHFALTVKREGAEQFVDPEPYLRRWRLISEPAAVTMR
jgi:murein DD-endopeptidase MepM/ murein hydrolase activator NlpD